MSSICLKTVLGAFGREYCYWWNIVIFPYFPLTWRSGKREMMPCALKLWKFYVLPPALISLPERLWSFIIFHCCYDKLPQTGVWNNSNLLSSSSGGQKSNLNLPELKIKVLAGLSSFWRSLEECFFESSSF